MRVWVCWSRRQWQGRFQMYIFQLYTLHRPAARHACVCPYILAMVSLLERILAVKLLSYTRRDDHYRFLRALVHVSSYQPTEHIGGRPRGLLTPGIGKRGRYHATIAASIETQGMLSSHSRVARGYFKEHLRFQPLGVTATN